MLHKAMHELMHERIQIADAPDTDDIRRNVTRVARFVPKRVSKKRVMKELDDGS